MGGFEMSPEKSLITLSKFKDSEYLILSPAVGFCSIEIEPGMFLNQGSRIAKLKVLNTTYDLLLPPNVHGKVIFEEEMEIIFPVDYGQVLFKLNPESNNIINQKENLTLDDLSPVDETADSGYLVYAFTTGIFYTRPSPDSLPFVRLGQKINKGKALGLIEVMKTFNHIIFQGTENSDKGMVKKIYVEDAQEVKSGDPLFLIE